MTIIVFLYLITEDIDHDINLHSLNYVNKLRNVNMKDLHVNCLDQLILVVHLPDVSDVNTNDYIMMILLYTVTYCHIVDMYLH